MYFHRIKEKVKDLLFPKAFDGKQWCYIYDGVIFAVISYFIISLLYILQIFTNIDESINAFIIHLDYILNASNISNSKQIILVKKDENTCSTIGRAVNRKDFASVVRFLSISKDTYVDNLDEKNTYISKVNILRLQLGLVNRSTNSSVISSFFEIYKYFTINAPKEKQYISQESKRFMFYFEENLIRPKYGGVLKALKFPEFEQIKKFILNSFNGDELLDFGNRFVLGIENLLNSEFVLEISFLPRLQNNSENHSISNFKNEKILLEIGLYLSRRLPKRSILAPAAIIGIDFVFDGEKSVEEDEELKKAIYQANSTIVLGALTNIEHQTYQEIIKGENTFYSVASYSEQINTILPYKKFIASNTRVASINVSQTGKGYVSKVPLFIKASNGKLMPAFSLLISVLYLDKTKNLVGTDSYEYNLYKELEKIEHSISSGLYKGGISIKDIYIPTDKFGNMNIKFWGSTTWPNNLPYFKSVSMYECFDEKHLLEIANSKDIKESQISKLLPKFAHKRTKHPLLEYEKSIFIVAPFEKTDLDFYPTPFTANSLFRPQAQHLTGGEIHANTIQTILNKGFLYNINTLKLFTYIFLCALLSGLIFQKFSPQIGFVILGIFEFLTFYSGYYIYKNGYIMHLSPIIILFPIIWALTNISHYLRQRKLAQSTKEMFGRFVAPEVVEYLIKNPTQVKPGGEKVELTIFFSDLAGFTTISESLQPEDLVDMMNEYLGEMTELLFKHGGTLDKYIGDAIMAFWNYPRQQPDHAVKALMYTLEMHEKLKKLQAEWKARGLPKAYARAGINTASVVVGCIGSKTQMNFTCLGDGVNLASRLEGANKEYGTLYMCSESTYSKANHIIRFRFLDFLAVKGKREPVKVYEIVSVKGNEPQWYLEIGAMYEEAIQLHLNRRWDEAIKIFEEILKKYPDDGPSKTYLKRCLEYRENPPPQDWDGSYHLTHK